MMLAGGLAIYNLPISQYPPIAPPSIAIDAYYPGASAQTVEDSVIQIIEQKMIGFDKLLYMSATSDASGVGRIELTFAPGTDPDLAWAQVQNKLQLAMASLPSVVQRQGVKVSKSTRNWLMVVGLTSENDSMDEFDLADYAQSSIQQVLARVPGVGEVETFSSQYAMRIWLNPDRLTDYRLTVDDVIKGLQSYNVEVSAGQFGGAPAAEGQRLNASVIVQNLLKTPEEFAAIPLRTNPDGSVVRVRDVGRTELGTEKYGFQTLYNGRPATALAIRLAPGANALDTADAVKAKLKELSKYFPPGMKVIYPLDTTPFVKVAIEEVIKTLFEAILLVFLVMYLFLGNLRATLIPAIVIPVALVGALVGLYLLGYSINVLTLFAMVLAIGIVVDDAIVVVENVERIMSTENLPPREATRKAMDQIIGAIIAITLVLSAVFIPMAFFPGSTGAIYRQFAVTLVLTMAFSALMALTLTPALCATLLKPISAEHHQAKGGFFGWFNRLFDFGSRTYLGLAGRTLGKGARYMLIYLLIVGGVGILFLRMPTGFLPDEDQGVMFTQIQLPVGATQERTLRVIKQVEDYLLNNEKDAVRAMMAVAGFSFAGMGQNAAATFVNLRDWDERDRANLRVSAVAGRAMGAFSQIRDAQVYAFTPPAVMEMGRANGFDLQIKDLGGLGHEALMAARNQFLGLAAQNPVLMAVRPNGMDDTPQLHLEIDYAKAGALGLAVAEINSVLSAAWGGSYVNDFIDKGRVKKVYIMGQPSSRMLPSDLYKWYVRNNKGEMVPFSAFATANWIYGSPRLERYNGFPSVEILGQPAPGRSSGEAMAAVEAIMAQLPAGIGYEWTGLSYQERLSGSQAPALYALSVLVVFLCLAALYESWSVPFAVMLVVPLGVIGALAAAGLRGLSNDVYFQVGLLTTMGLAAKNAILIVEFAKSLHEQGMGLIEATLEAARLRLRPILMTSFAFILGVSPLVWAIGAGAELRQVLGTTVFSGMIGVTLFGLIFTPVFYVVSRWFAERVARRRAHAQGHPPHRGHSQA
jgi:HAE1 family hydrophobic/amphiphilic exporter-1